MSRQHPYPARTDSKPPHASHSPVTILAFALIPPVAVLALSYPLAATTALAGLAVLATAARWLVPRASARADGRRASVPLPGLGLRLELALADE